MLTGKFTCTLYFFTCFLQLPQCVYICLSWYNTIISYLVLSYVQCLGVHITSDLKDSTAIRHQIPNIYSWGNSIIRNFSHCSDDVNCQLFQSYCTNFYCAPLWCCYNTESMRLLKVAYNRVFRILMNLVHRTSMSTNFVSRGMNPFKVIIRWLTGSFKSRIFNSMNTLIQSIVSSRFFSSADQIQSAGAIGGLILWCPRRQCPSTFYANRYSSYSS